MLSKSLCHKDSAGLSMFRRKFVAMSGRLSNPSKLPNRTSKETSNHPDCSQNTPVTPQTQPNSHADEHAQNITKHQHHKFVKRFIPDYHVPGTTTPQCQPHNPPPPFPIVTTMFSRFNKFRPHASNSQGFLFCFTHGVQIKSRKDLFWMQKY